ncbi:MAG TPA: NlpC/P60 family protein, partial [Chitinophagaceae bacterium]|nr:NlpC/P60 family protein [Chitinophagaceae bacterium]
MMKSYSTAGFLFFFLCAMSCNQLNSKTGERDESVSWEEEDTAVQKENAVVQLKDTAVHIAIAKTDNVGNKDTAYLPPSQTINIGSTKPEDVVKFAESLMGTPYVYASSNPSVGFDCSGFITYVFNHFKIAVPRSSVDFTNVGKTVPVGEA